MKLFLAGLSALWLGGCAMTAVDSKVPGYLTTPHGGILKSSTGQCWRTVDWTPDHAIEECDPEIARRKSGRVILPPVEEPPEKAERREVDRTAWKRPEEDTPPETSAEVSAALDAERAVSLEVPLVLSSDAVFHFGKDRLSSRGEEAIDYLVAALKRQGGKDILVTVYGHTDRIGSRRDNLLLSRRRANTVRDALIGRGIAADVIRTEGLGESRPVTREDDCPPDLVRCELISCLSADRRVEIRISGTRTVESRR